ncbi:MAG TPA: sigma-70 family RNA polymerase sigma factor [Bryobacteraceae bacterium]|jgi:RNA polymerase sigma-70 factor (ECF subfamily)
MRRFHPVIAAAATRASRQWGRGASDEIDDIVQEIYLKFCAGQARILTNFRSPEEEAIYGYVKVAATNIAHDFFRKHHAAKRGAHQTVSASQIADVAAAFPNMDRQLSLAEIDQTLRNQTEQNNNGKRDRAVFRLYYRHGMTAQAIAGLPGIGLTSKGVEGVLHRLTKAIRMALGNMQGSEAE